MSRRIGSAAIALLVLGLAAPARGAKDDVEFYASVSEDEIGLDDTVTLTVTLNSAGEANHLSLPEPADFEVLSKEHSDQMSFAFGTGGTPQVRHARVYTLRLRPRRTGNLVIPEASVVVRGSKHLTAKITVHVVPGTVAKKPTVKKIPPAVPGFPTNPFAGLPGMDDDDSPFDPWAGSIDDLAGKAGEQDLFLRCVLDKKAVWLGEQITMSIYLMSRVDISGVEGFKMPKLDGFWAEDLESPNQIAPEIKYLNNVPYRMYLLKRRALFPTQSGKLTVEGVEVEVQTGFGGIFGSKKVHRQSPNQVIDVRPLPKDGVPAGFESVNVGEWRLTADTAEARGAVGQPVTLKAVLSGKGNLRSITTPRLKPPPNTKVFEPTVTDKVTIEKLRFGGSKVVEIILVPERTGELVIPGLEWSYFSPVQKRYETLRTREIRIPVSAGAVAGTSGTPGVIPGVGGTNVLSGGLKPIRYHAELRSQSAPLWSRGFFGPLLALPVLAYAGLALMERIRDSVRRGDGDRRTRRAGSRARRRLKEARRLQTAGKAKDFYAEVTRALTDYVGDKLRRPVVGLTRPELTATLQRAGAHHPAVQQLVGALDACDAGRFAPGPQGAQMEAVLDAAQKAMETLEEAELKSPAEAA